jgi:alkanesulfonate monooxygenase SsuD/methylene tetrahydromethanopterin reductase-like flavin-dependent oxidoreductase (luciferase family)
MPFAAGFTWAGDGSLACDTSIACFDIATDGANITLRGARCSPPPAGTPRFYQGGASPRAESLAARHADMYLMWIEPLEPIAARMARVTTQAQARRMAQHRVGAHLWNGLAMVRVNCGTAIVGTPQQVTDELLAYWQLGMMSSSYRVSLTWRNAYA